MDKSPLSETDAALARIRESSQFYLKIDFGLLAAAITLASVFKLDGWNFLENLTSHTSELYAIGILIVYALVLEFFLTYARNSLVRLEGDTDARRILNAFTVAYALQVFAHVVLLFGIAAFIAGALSCMSEPGCAGT